mmetsp:Transcript_22805/g.65755  ORF Transcript_22805/g.65755 Transcript_22805/m.65755 type:complete len:278 (-) Transcript_22805:11-844(-)
MPAGMCGACRWHALVPRSRCKCSSIAMVGGWRARRRRASRRKRAPLFPRIPQCPSRKMRCFWSAAPSGQRSQRPAIQKPWCPSGNGARSLRARPKHRASCPRATGACTAPSKTTKSSAPSQLVPQRHQSQSACASTRLCSVRMASRTRWTRGFASGGLCGAASWRPTSGTDACSLRNPSLACEAKTLAPSAAARFRRRLRCPRWRSLGAITSSTRRASSTSRTTTGLAHVAAGRWTGPRWCSRCVAAASDFGAFAARPPEAAEIACHEGEIRTGARP